MRGKYAVIAVRTVLGICREAEAAFDHAEHYEYLISNLVEVRVFKPGGVECWGVLDFRGVSSFLGMSKISSILLTSPKIWGVPNLVH